jgi:hypothetical protein
MATDNAAPAANQTIEVSRSQGVAEIDPLAIIERRNQMLERLLDYAIKATHAGQWTDQQGKPFPTAAAAEVMARRCAVRIANVKKQKIDSQDDQGPFYMYLVEAVASLPGEWDSIEAMGTCISRDQFIGTNGAKRQLSEIDEGNILKAAYSNMVVNAVTRLLGVRNLTWEALAKLGISQDGAAKVEYQHGSQGGGQSRSSSDVDLKFGKGKGKKLSEVSDDDVRWYMAAWEKDLSDPSKEKYHRFCKRDLEIGQALLAARANAAAGTSTPSAGAAAPSPWERIRALDKTVPEPELKELVKSATKKTNAKDLVEADVALVAAALQKRAESMTSDIPF